MTDGRGRMSRSAIRSGRVPGARGAASLSSRSPASTSYGRRATDADGRVQPTEPPWNVWGYQNNACERVPLVVESV